MEPKVEQNIKEESFYEVGGVYTAFSGDPELVGKAVDRYFDEYNPCGYATTIKSDVTTDGIRSVLVYRFSSCD